jgi:hypothetical protein
VPLRRPSSFAAPKDSDQAAAPAAPDEAENSPYEEEDEDETPSTASSLQEMAGWDAARRVLEQAAASGGDFPWSADQELVKFLFDGPVVSYLQHWVEGTNVERKAYTCLTTNCPLCDIGIKTRARFGFSVALIREEVTGPMLLWSGPKLCEDLSEASKARTGPLTKHYYAVHKTGEKMKTKYHLQLVRDRDLPEEWNLDAADVAAECAKLSPHDPKDVAPDKATAAELREVARSLS